MTPKDKAKLKRLIRDYTKAYHADRISGGGHPEEMDEVAEWHKKSKKKLYDFINYYGAGKC